MIVCCGCVVCFDVLLAIGVIVVVVVGDWWGCGTKFMKSLREDNFK